MTLQPLITCPHITLGRFIASAEASDPHGDGHAQDHVNSGF